MHELIHDSFYELLKRYDRVEIDYCILENDVPNMGYQSHKDAVVYAMRRLQEKYPWIIFEKNKANGEKVPADVLFVIPDIFGNDNLRTSESVNVDWHTGEKKSYYHAFVNPPHGTGPVIIDGKRIRNQYSSEDFEIVNNALFPKGIDELEVYDWTTDWSNYFDAGHEWWGTLCYSVYDKKLNRYIVLMASSTD